MKVICLHHRLGGLTSHHFNEAHGLREELARRRIELALLVSTHAQPDVVAQLRAKAVFDDPTFRTEWSFEERSRRFAAMLHEHVDPIVKRDDRVLLTIATQLEAHALLRWLQELPSKKKPWIVILFLSDRWNRVAGEEHERQIAELRLLADAVRLSPHANRIIFLAATDLLAAELTDLLGTPVAEAPLPLRYAAPALAPAPTRPLPRVAILGGTRREKGSHRVAGIVRACRDRVEVEFLIELANDTLPPEDVRNLAAVAEEPNVIAIRDPMTLPQYHAALQSADVVLCPYDVVPYRIRTSGVFAEAVACGKPLVVSPGTWMAREIDEGRAAGIVAESIEEESFAAAIAQCIASLASLRQAAATLAPSWRRNVSVAAFIDVVERSITMRGGPPARPPARWWRR